MSEGLVAAINIFCGMEDPEAARNVDLFLAVLSGKVPV
jgi:hypothetical protein